MNTEKLEKIQRSYFFSDERKRVDRLLKLAHIFALCVCVVAFFNVQERCRCSSLFRFASGKNKEKLRNKNLRDHFS